MVNSEITAELAMDIGRSMAEISSSVILGYDPRLSNKMLASSIASGVMSGGCDIHVAGMVTTPTLAYAARNYDYGLMVTASHNPAPYNGVKFWNRDGAAFNTKQMLEMEDMILGKTYRSAEWNELGAHASYPNATNEHIERILQLVSSREIKVVVDCGCGAASKTTPKLLKEMGCEVIAINSEPDGRFPARDPEPKEKNIGELLSAVKKHEARLGIAHDGDADRMMAVDENGKYLSGDELTAIFASRETKKGLVVPVNASLAITDSMDMPVHKCKVGDVFVAEVLKDTGSDFGAEPSGTFIFPRLSYCPDGIFAAARIVEIAAEEKLSTLTRQMPKYSTLKNEFVYEKNQKERILVAIGEGLKSVDGELNDLDGYRMDMEDGWFLIRSSGTEPKIRITAEAKEQGVAENLLSTAKKVVDVAIGV